jgi:L-amino acid N-acyltransferase YncA
MSIRAARREDAAQICALWNPLIETTATTFTTTLKTVDSVAADIAARGDAFIVAYSGDQLLGFSTYFPFRSGPGYARTKEHSINLSPEARGRGTGRALMQALEAQARADEIHALWAGISAENPAGVTFHRRVGFTEIARLPEVGYKFGRWMDLVLMQKRLD